MWGWLLCRFGRHDFGYKRVTCKRCRSWKPGLKREAPPCEHEYKVVYDDRHASVFGGVQGEVLYRCEACGQEKSIEYGKN